MKLENTHVYKPIDKYAGKLIKTHRMTNVGQHSRDTSDVSAERLRVTGRRDPEASCAPGRASPPSVSGTLSACL